MTDRRLFAARLAPGDTILQELPFGGTTRQILVTGVERDHPVEHQGRTHLVTRITGTVPADHDRTVILLGTERTRFTVLPKRARVSALA